MKTFRFWKALFGFLLLYCLCFQPNLYAQGTADGFLYVYPNDPSVFPSSTNPPYTNNATINNLFTSHNVVQYKLSFPGIQHPVLQKAHEIHLNGDVNALLVALENTGYYDTIELSGYYRTLNTNTYTDNSSRLLAGDCMGCTNPISFNDPDVSWELDLIGAPCAWEITQGDPNIIVAVVDTEFDENHPDLTGKIAYEVGNDANVQLGCFHGTQVSGAVASDVNDGVFTAGVGNQTRIGGYVVENTIPIDRDNDGIPDGCSGNPWPAASQAFMNGERIINMSWGGNFGSDTDSMLVQMMVDNGAILVVAAGPPDDDATQHVVGNSHGAYANIPGVINVTAHMFNTHIPLAYPKNKWVDISAPGIDISRIQSPAPGIAIGGGTSISAPIVAGTAALMLSVNPCLTGVEIEEILKGTAKPIINPNNYDEGIIGAGHLCAYEAVLAASKASDIFITSDEEWTFPRSFDGNITIEDGATLTISSTVYFHGEFNKITVDPGGKLIVDGGKLTTGCDNDKWSGIEVLGTPSQSQFPVGGQVQQGVVELNNATIENASFGVALHRHHPYTLGGGILKATNSTFKNNLQAVSFFDYENFSPSSNTPFRNLSLIRGCTFTLDDNYPFSYFSKHIYMNEVSGVIITNNTNFTDERSAGLSEVEQGAGIYSLNAQFTVRNSSFSNLRFGINAQNISSVRTFSVRGSSFINNHIGVNTRAVNNFTVAEDTFSIGGYMQSIPSLNDDLNHTGVFIDRSTGFILEGNTFTGNEDNALSVPIGVCARNTNLDEKGNNVLDFNSINDNTFNLLDYGNLANLSNRGSLTDGGLTYLCNISPQDGNATDFAVDIDGTIALKQIASGGVAAGNQFSNNNNGNPLSDFDNQGAKIEYYYFGNGTREEPIYIDPAKVDKILANQNLCNGEIDDDEYTDPDKEDVKQVFNGVKSTYDGLWYQYKNAIDGGDTPSTLASINNATPINVVTVKNQLETYAPYLSKEVALAVIANTVFSSTQSFDVLTGNPEVVKLEEVMYEIENSGKFNSSEIQYLQQVATQQSARTTLESGIASAFGEMHYNANRLIRHYLSDTTNMHMDSIRLWLDNKGSLESELGQVEAFLQEGDVSAVGTALNNIPFFYNFTTAQQQEFDYYDDLKQIEIGLINAGRTLLELNTTEQNQVQTIANNSIGLAGIQAQNLLNLAYGGTYQNEPILPGGAPKPLVRPSDQSSNSVDMVKAIPNPAQDQVVFQYQIPKDILKAEILISDINGRQISIIKIDPLSNSIIWDSSMLPNGIYIYTLVFDSTKGITHKLIISR
jgi:hypothetical protein